MTAPVAEATLSTMETSTGSTSFWQQWSQDATHAFQDMYGSWVLGDDAGQSAKLVVVVNGTGSAAVSSSAIQTATGSSPSASGSSASSQQQSQNKQQSSQNSLTRSQHRDPTNMRSTVSKHHHHHHTLSSLGVTFCEINGRAYVQTVTPKSRAAEAGVVTRDCVQYAAVLAKEWKDPLGEDFSDIRKHALEREESGQRISYKELKGLLQNGALMEESSAGAGCLAPRSVPTTIQVGGSSSAVAGTNPCGPLGGQQGYGGNSVSSLQEKQTQLPPPTAASAANTDARPVVLVFRRTKQRPSTMLPIWPHYRLDDECDVACQILQSLATSPPKAEGRSNKNAGASTASTTSGSSFNSSETNKSDEETVEAATIRAMIQNAVGLAFMRSNKLVLGVSVHAGSGIVIARLPDGTWSAPSAIGIAGMGLGFQLGIDA